MILDHAAVCPRDLVPVRLISSLLFWDLHIVVQWVTWCFRPSHPVRTDSVVTCQCGSWLAWAMYTVLSTNRLLLNVWTMDRLLTGGPLVSCNDVLTLYNQWQMSRIKADLLNIRESDFTVQAKGRFNVQQQGRSSTVQQQGRLIVQQKGLFTVRPFYCAATRPIDLLCNKKAIYCVTARSVYCATARPIDILSNKKGWFTTQKQGRLTATKRPM